MVTSSAKGWDAEIERVQQLMVGRIVEAHLARLSKRRLELEAVWVGWQFRAPSIPRRGRRCKEP